MKLHGDLHGIYTVEGADPHRPGASVFSPGDIRKITEQGALP